MPKEFTDCVEGGGRVRTVKPKGKKSSIYVHVCYDKEGSHGGEVKHAKSGGNFEPTGNSTDPYDHITPMSQDRNYP